MTAIGFLKKGQLFRLNNRIYKIGSFIDGTNGYVACVDIETHKVARVHIDTSVEEVKEQA